VFHHRGTEGHRGITYLTEIPIALPRLRIFLVLEGNFLQEIEKTSNKYHR
jgi:hypothetical protein